MLYVYKALGVLLHRDLNIQISKLTGITLWVEDEEVKISFVVPLRRGLKFTIIQVLSTKNPAQLEPIAGVRYLFLYSNEMTKTKNL